MRLNLGADKTRLPGWTSVDQSDKAKAEIKLDLRFHPWPWDTNSIDEILASHILEHFDKRDGVSFMRACYRILKPGGKLYIAVPDMDKFIEARNTGNWDGIGTYIWRDLNHFMGGDESEQRPLWRHRYMYSFESLAYALNIKCGFAVHKRVGPSAFDNFDYEKISLYVTAEKVLASE